jgi:hypothetical protein
MDLFPGLPSLQKIDAFLKATPLPPVQPTPNEREDEAQDDTALHNEEDHQ